MRELSFKSYSYVSVPSGTYLFFPSLEERTAQEEGDWLTIVGYDVLPYWSGFRAGTTLHVSFEDADFHRLEAELCQQDLQREPVLVRYETDSAGTLTRFSLDRHGVDGRQPSYVRELVPAGARPPAPAMQA